MTCPPGASLEDLRSVDSYWAGTKPMRRDSIDRTGRVGDFQWRFFRGSLFSIIGRAMGNRPDGSVYSTGVHIKASVSESLYGVALHVPVTLFEAAWGEVSIFPKYYLGRLRPAIMDITVGL